jgi:hypothetical protein
MKRELFDIWEDPNPPHIAFPIAVQMVNYVGHYSCRETAESFITSTKKALAQDQKAVTSK